MRALGTTLVVFENLMGVIHRSLVDLKWFVFGTSTCIGKLIQFLRLVQLWRLLIYTSTNASNQTDSNFSTVAVWEVKLPIPRAPSEEVMDEHSAT